MFDWNDEELANIIWGEAAESDDHIVPYPEASENCYNKKEWNQDTANTKQTEQKSPETKVDTNVIKLKGSPGNEERISTSNLSNDLLDDASLSKACRIQESMGTKVSIELTENSKYFSPRRALTAEDSQNFQSTEEGEETADFVDYGWANIGSFDDLERIFSNEETLFGQVSLDDADELWSSSKDVPNSPVKLFRTVDSQNLESGVDAQEHVNSEYLKQNEQLSSLASGSINDAGSHGLQTGNAFSVNVGGKSRAAVKHQKDFEKTAEATAAILHQTDSIVNTNEFSNKIGRQKKLFKSRRKTEGKAEEKMLQDFCGNWSLSTNRAGHFDSHLAPPLLKSSPPSTLTQHRQLQGVESSQYQRISNPLVHHPFYSTAANSYPAMPLLSQNFPGDLQHQPLLSHDISQTGANRVDKSADNFAKSLTMTPQEKIEKLRRRQQMQAMLAIQKQQQQFSSQVSTASQSISPKFPQEIQCQRMEKGDLDSEEIYTLPALDPKSPLEQDDSNTISTVVDHYSLEETILCRLQEIISKLDFKIRLCIRDSLFRLAQSAMQRHYTNDTSSSNKSTKDEHDMIAKGEMSSHCRIAGMPDAETETNPIDRTVAHLLFHRPFELSGSYSDTPESPVSTKLSYEPRAGFKSLPMECLHDGSNGNQHVSHDGAKEFWASVEARRIKTSPHIDNSDNMSNDGLADDAVLEYEASG